MQLAGDPETGLVSGSGHWPQPAGDPLQLQFKAHRYGPYANNLTHLLNAMDGSYLQSDKRIRIASRLMSSGLMRPKTRACRLSPDRGQSILPILEQTTALIDGFESPYGMELLATVDWLIAEEGCAPTLSALREGLHRWPAGTPWVSARRGCLMIAVCRSP